jgi:signal transduction histidine kinase/DNA-binding response OmpR family regulator/PAS domain-containing protein
MPKKKPIDKRLNKLFENLTPEEAAQPKTVSSQQVMGERAQPAAGGPTSPSAHLVEITKRVASNEAAMSLAIQTGQNNWATLQVVDETSPRAWSQDEQLLVQQVADQLSLALENARLFQETQSRAEELSVLNEMGRELSTKLEVSAIAEVIYRYTSRLMDTSNFFIALYDAKNEEKSYPLVLEEGKRVQLSPGKLGNRGFSDYIIRNKKAVFAPIDVLDHMRALGIEFVPLNEDETPSQCWLGVPLLIGERVLGVISVQNVQKPNVYDEHDRDILATIASQAAIAIENARLFNEVTTSQGQLSEALQIARLGYFEIDLKEQTIQLTDELYSLLGTSMEKEGEYQLPLESAIKRFIIDEDIPIMTAAIEQATLAPEESPETETETRFQTSDGRTIWVRSIFKLERNPESQPIKIVGSSQDITDRKTNELTQAAITHISDTALTVSRIEDLIKTVHNVTGTLIPAKNFYVALYNSETDLMTFPYYVDEYDQPMPPQKLGRGLTSHVIRTGRPLRATPEIYTELEESGEVIGGGTRSVDWLGVPLRSETAVRGVMAVQSYDPSIRITERHKEILTILGVQVTAAIERLQARAALQRRNTYLSASSEIGRLVTSTLELNTIFTRTVNLVSERFGFYYAAIYTIEETGSNIILREATGAAGEKMKAQKYMLPVGSQTIVGMVADTGESKLVDDISAEPLYQPNPLLLDTQSEVAVPLRIGSRIVGVIDIQSTQTSAFTQDDISVLQSLADQVTVAIDNARSYELSQQAIRELREVDQIKSQFLANMSHELRTPLNSIIGFSRVILKGIDGAVTDLQQQDLTAIYNSGQHLLGLINDVLDLARIEAGKMELNFEEVHLSEMVTSVMSTAKGLVKEKRIQLLQRIPADMPPVRGDTMRVRQVLLNLISNASKFTDEGSITVEALVQKGPTGKMEALINVIDTGPGISLEDQKKLFQAFSQVDGSATRRSGGSGLGLSICANLVQLHGGRIGVHSEVERGSTFYFTIPLFDQPFEEIPPDKKVVLAIDDDPHVISLYERYLNPQGYHVVPLTDPTKAKELILALKPYAITLDIMMPNKDGWTVITDLKSDPDTRDYPVVICSIMEQADKGFSLGAADYLIKPILQEDLAQALTRLNKNGTIRDVLVIDDDPNDLRLIGKILNEHGDYKPILAQGGHKGWEAINAKIPHAIILDVFMPEMDGFMILEKLRENPTLRDIPVLVVSGGGLTNEQQQQLSDFGQRLITKASLNEGDLIESIESALKRIGS